VYLAGTLYRVPAIDNRHFDKAIGGGGSYDSIHKPLPRKKTFSIIV
jgi:hypothetical protein